MDCLCRIRAGILIRRAIRKFLDEWIAFRSSRLTYIEIRLITESVFVVVGTESDIDELAVIFGDREGEEDGE